MSFTLIQDLLLIKRIKNYLFTVDYVNSKISILWSDQLWNISDYMKCTSKYNKIQLADKRDSFDVYGRQWKIVEMKLRHIFFLLLMKWTHFSNKTYAVYVKYISFIIV